MSRHTALLAFGWLSIIAMQTWLLYRIEAALPRASETPSAIISPASDLSSNASSDQAEISALLKRIDARLAATDRDPAHGRKIGASNIPAMIAPGSPEAHAADKILTGMLPPGPMTDAQMAQLRVQIAQLPVEQRFPVSAALARAINSGRIQPRPR